MDTDAMRSFSCQLRVARLYHSHYPELQELRSSLASLISRELTWADSKAPCFHYRGRFLIGKLKSHQPHMVVKN